MKIFIKFDDRNYLTIALLCLSLLFTVLFIFTFSNTTVSIKALNIVLVLFIISLAFSVSKIGITFNYDEEIIRVYVPSSNLYCKIRMRDIRQIELIEIPKKRKKMFFSTFTKTELSFGIYWEPDYIYRNGKIFNIIITKKDGVKYTIFYGMLFKARSEKRVKNQEDRINNAIKEFNNQRLKT